MSGLGDDGIWLRFRLAGIDGYPFLHALLKTDLGLCQLLLIARQSLLNIHVIGLGK